MVSPAVFLLQVFWIQYALCQPTNTPPMTNIDLFRTNTRDVQLQAQIKTPESSPALDISAKVPVTPNQQIDQRPSMVPSSNDFLLTNLGMTKTVIPRTTTNEARDTQVEGQTATQGLVKDTQANVPTVPKTPINPYKHLLPNNNVFMNPSMTNMGLGIGVSRQATNRAVVPSQTFNGAVMPSQRLNGAVMPSQTFNRAVMPTQTFKEAAMPSQTFNRAVMPTQKLNGVDMPSQTFNRAVMPTQTFKEAAMPSQMLNEAGMSIQTFNGPVMPTQTFHGAVMPSQMLNEAGMSKMMQGLTGTAEEAVNDELPMTWRNVRKTSRMY